jgi:hypothetical protein
MIVFKIRIANLTKMTNAINPKRAHQNPNKAPKREAIKK